MLKDINKNQNNNNKVKEIKTYIEENSLLPKKELEKLIMKLNRICQKDPNNLYLYNLNKAFDTLGNKKNKLYFQEFLTLKDAKNQDKFLKKYTGFKGFLNKSNENKFSMFLSLSKKISNIEIAKMGVVSLNTHSIIPPSIITLSVILRLSTPLFIKYIGQNIKTNNEKIEYVNNRIKEVEKINKNKELKDYSIEDKNKLITILKLVPNITNKTMSLPEKLNFFKDSIILLKNTNNYIKSNLSNQSLDLTYIYINRLLKELKKNNISINEIKNKSIDKESFESLQSKIFMGILENNKNTYSLLSGLKSVDEDLKDEFQEDVEEFINANLKKNHIYVLTNELLFKDDYLRRSITNITIKYLDEYLESSPEKIIDLMNKVNEQVNSIENEITIKSKEGVVELGKALKNLNLSSYEEEMINKKEVVLNMLEKYPEKIMTLINVMNEDILKKDNINLEPIEEKIKILSSMLTKKNEKDLTLEDFIEDLKEKLDSIKEISIDLLGEKIGDKSIEVKERISKDIDRRLKTNIIEVKKTKFNIMLKNSIQLMLFLEKHINNVFIKLEKIKNDFLNNHLTVKKCYNKTKEAINFYWESMVKVKEFIFSSGFNIIEKTGGLIERTDNQFEKEFKDSNINNYKEKLTISSKSQLLNIKKKSQLFDTKEEAIEKIKISLK